MQIYDIPVSVAIVIAQTRNYSLSYHNCHPYSYILGSAMKMKIAVKGGAAVDPDSGNYIISFPFLSREFAHAQ